MTQQLVERYRQLIRVMEGLSEHDREDHFQMTSWATRAADCGTAMCAAGWAASDEWFIKQGFKMEGAAPAIPGKVGYFRRGWAAVHLFFDGRENYDVRRRLGLHHPVFEAPETVEQVIEAARWRIYSLERYGV